jgi:hypothetical protein
MDFNAKFCQNRIEIVAVEQQRLSAGHWGTLLKNTAVGTTAEISQNGDSKRRFRLGHRTALLQRGDDVNLEFSECNGFCHFNYSLKDRQIVPEILQNALCSNADPKIYAYPLTPV